MKNIVGPRVREARRRQVPRLTQEGLCLQLQLAGWNLARSGRAKIETGLREVRDIEVVRLAQALGVTAAWLFGEDTAEQGRLGGPLHQ